MKKLLIGLAVKYMPKAIKDEIVREAEKNMMRDLMAMARKPWFSASHRDPRSFIRVQKMPD